jgi:hypothetical protein
MSSSLIQSSLSVQLSVVLSVMKPLPWSVSVTACCLVTSSPSGRRTLVSLPSESFSAAQRAPAGLMDANLRRIGERTASGTRQPPTLNSAW